jgi:hypothetical protein
VFPLHFLLAGAGVWLMFAPAMLDYGDPAATSDRVAGPALAAIGFLSAFAITRGLRWLNVVTGAWLVVGPWLLAFPTEALVNSVVIGLAALAIAPWGKPDQGRYGGGWAVLWRPVGSG